MSEKAKDKHKLHQ